MAMFKDSVCYQEEAPENGYITKKRYCRALFYREVFYPFYVIFTEMDSKKRTEFQDSWSQHPHNLAPGEGCHSDLRGLESCH